MPVWSFVQKLLRRDVEPAEKQGVSEPRLNAGELDQLGQSPSSLVSDKPISSAEQDRLGFASFADALAQSLMSMIPPEGLVLSIEGEWGSGKTSALELALNRVMARELARVKEHRVEVYETRSRHELEA